VDLLHHVLGDAVEDVLLVGDVVVQRHRLGADELAEAAHGERGDALLIGDTYGGPQDAVPGERDARLGGGGGYHPGHRTLGGMRFRKLGSSDLEISEISLGAWLTYE